MSFRTALAIALAISGGFSVALAQAPAPKAVPTAEIERIAIDVLKEMHNRGAELYNAGDPSGCLKVYGTALLTAKAFLKHRPAVQKAIDDGMADLEKIESAKAQAFRLHELIEKVRGDLKGEAKREEAPEPNAEVKPAILSGTLTLDGKPVSGAAVTFAGKGRAFTAITEAGGRYAITDAMPAGAYALIVTGAGVPEKFGGSATPGIVAEIAAGKNTRDLALRSE